MIKQIKALDNPSDIYPLGLKPIDFGFYQDIRRFVVDEITTLRPSKSGNYVALRIQKQNLSSWKLLSIIAQSAQLDIKSIGYAGLKDKHATTTQYFTIPKNHLKLFKKNFTTSQAQLLEEFIVKNPLKLGDLKSNHFRIILDVASSQDAKKAQEALELIEQNGMPNFFGYQRFGDDGQSHTQGQKIVAEQKRLKGEREKFKVAAHQSRLFNQWLHYRIVISQTVASHPTSKAASMLQFPEPLVEFLASQPHFFKYFIGDIGLQKGRYVHFGQKISNLNRLPIVPTGILSGLRVPRARADAKEIEALFDDSELLTLNGARRAAWVWPKQCSFSYNAGKKEATVGFELPAGSYATTLLEQMSCSQLKENYGKKKS